MHVCAADAVPCRKICSIFRRLQAVFDRLSEQNYSSTLNQQVLANTTNPFFPEQIVQGRSISPDGVVARAIRHYIYFALDIAVLR